MQEAGTGFGLKDGTLFTDGVDEVLLRRATLGEALIERGVVRIPSASEFGDQSFVALIERLLLPYPTERLGVASIAAPPAMFGQDIPEPVELAMLGEQMHTA